LATIYQRENWSKCEFPAINEFKVPFCEFRVKPTAEHFDFKTGVRKRTRLFDNAWVMAKVITSENTN